MVECNPSSAMEKSSSGKLLKWNPARHKSMMPASSPLTHLMIEARSILSARRPARAEAQKKGKMNKPAARFDTNPVESELNCAPWNASSAIMAFLARLSLKAPKN